MRGWLASWPALATLYPVLYRMEDEGQLRADQQVVDGRARQVFGITPIALSTLDETTTHR